MSCLWLEWGVSKGVGGVGEWSWEIIESVGNRKGEEIADSPEDVDELKLGLMKGAGWAAEGDCTGGNLSRTSKPSMERGGKVLWAR